MWVLLLQSGQRKKAERTQNVAPVIGNFCICKCVRVCCSCACVCWPSALTRTPPQRRLFEHGQQALPSPEYAIASLLFSCAFCQKPRVAHAPNAHTHPHTHAHSKRGRKGWPKGSGRFRSHRLTKSSRVSAAVAGSNALSALRFLYTVRTQANERLAAPQRNFLKSRYYFLKYRKKYIECSINCDHRR